MLAATTPPGELDALLGPARGELYITRLHVSNIIRKLGVSGRGEAAAVAHRLGLRHPAAMSGIGIACRARAVASARRPGCGLGRRRRHPTREARRRDHRYRLVGRAAPGTAGRSLI
jgi:hypothetical protein